VRPLIESITARLEAATGNTVARIEYPDHVRLEVAIPAGLTDQNRGFLLAALADADDYGHDRADSEPEYVWASIKVEDE
jgi:hypothetical protein